MSGRITKETGRKKETIKATEELLSLAGSAHSLEQSARIKTDYLERAEPKSKETVGEVSSLRERILSLSLFPNIYNQKYLAGSS